MNEPKAQFAANNAQIARALGLSPKRRATLAEIGDWRKRADFPKKQKRGYLVSELREWYGGFLEEQNQNAALFDPELVEKLRKQNLVKRFTEGRKLAEPEKNELREMGLLKDKAVERAGPLGYVANQAALAETLARHFGRKFGFDFSENKISEWYRGRGIPKGRPPCPVKIRGRINADEFAAWVEACFASQLNGSEKDLLNDYGSRIDLANLKERESNARLAEIALENEQRELDAKWILRASVYSTLEQLILQFRGAVRLKTEGGLVDSIREHSQRMNYTPEQTAANCQWATEYGIQWQTAIEDALGRLGETKFEATDSHV